MGSQILSLGGAALMLLLTLAGLGQAMAKTGLTLEKMIETAPQYGKLMNLVRPGLEIGLNYPYIPFFEILIVYCIYGIWQQISSLFMFIITIIAICYGVIKKIFHREKREAGLPY